MLMNKDFKYFSEMNKTFVSVQKKPGIFYKFIRC